jgi:choloylglycine hydrolase
MKTHLSIFAFIIVTSFAGVGDARACTTFCIHTEKELVFGRNFDFYTGVGHVVINKRGVRKTSYPLPPEKELVWTARLGSLTFNQMGKEFPYGGINEKGLVIELMWLDDTKYPEIDDRYGLTELQWIQYQLDNSASVSDILASDKKVRMSKLSEAPVHVLVVDAAGNKATLEYINGKLISHTGSSLPVCVLANDTYDASSRYMKMKTKNNKKSNQPFTSGSNDRFTKAALMVGEMKGPDAVSYAFDILEEVSQPGFTRWSIVYDIRNMTVHYRTQANQERRSIRVADLDFSCDATLQIAGIDENMKGSTITFRPYSYEENLALVNKSFSQVKFLQSVTKEEREVVARYPESVVCEE